MDANGLKSTVDSDSRDWRTWKKDDADVYREYVVLLHKISITEETRHCRKHFNLYVYYVLFVNLNCPFRVPLLMN